MIKLGQRVKDTLTGFEGTVTGRTEYLTGCNVILLQPDSKKDGAWIDGIWLDETRVKVIKRKVYKLPVPVTDKIRRAGACQMAPKDYSSEAFSE